MTELIGPQDLKRAAALLKKGEIVAFPTETVYGLGAPIFNPMAIQKIFDVKGRPQDNPLIAHLSTIEEIYQIAQEIPEDFFKLATAFFPGPLTVVLEKHPSVPKAVSAGLNTIAVRLPSHPVARELIRLLGEPIVAPSANLSGKPSATCAEHVLEDFEGRIAAVIDGGPSRIGIESTVLSLYRCKTPLLFRPGEINVQALENILQKKIEVFSASTDIPLPSPGMRYRHYAPNAPLKLFKEWQSLCDYLKAHPKTKRLVLTNQELPIPAITYPLSTKELYSALRLADQKGYTEIVAFCDTDILANPALMNRLMRASSLSAEF